MNRERLAKGVQIPRLLHGDRNLGYICELLMKHGKSPLVPAMAIQWAHGAATEC